MPRGPNHWRGLPFVVLQVGLVTSGTGPPTEASAAALVGWGDNQFSQILFDQATRHSAPIEIVSNAVIGDDPIVAVTVSYSHTVMLSASGVLWARGLNNLGQLGNGTNSPSPAPIQVDRSGALAGKKV